MGFGKLLEQKMIEKNVKQSDLAAAVDIPKTTLNSIIVRDNTKIEIEKFLKICEYLDCDPEEFFNEFRRSKKKTISPSFIEKFNSIDKYGVEVVESVLNIEYKRCTENRKITNIKDSELAVARSSTRNFMPVPTDEQIAMMDEVTPDMLGE